MGNKNIIISESKEEYINFILQELITHPKGIKGKLEIVGKFRNKFGKEKSTFNDAWSYAKIRYIDNSIQQTNKLSTKSQTEVSKRNIISKVEALEILSGIAQNPKESGKQDQTTKTADKIKAIETMAKIEGWNAPKQIEDVTNKPYTKEELKQQLKDLGIEEE